MQWHNINTAKLICNRQKTTDVFWLCWLNMESTARIRYCGFHFDYVYVQCREYIFIIIDFIHRVILLLQYMSTDIDNSHFMKWQFYPNNFITGINDYFVLLNRICYSVLREYWINDVHIMLYLTWLQMQSN